MKKHSLTVVTVVISFIVLAGSLAIWPYLEGMLLAKMEQAVSEGTHDRKPDPSGRVLQEEKANSLRGDISGPMRFTLWAGCAALDLRRTTMEWGGYGNMIRLFELYLLNVLFKRLGILRARIRRVGTFLKNTISFGKTVSLVAVFMNPIATRITFQGRRRMNRLLTFIFCSMIFLLLNTPKVSAQFSEAGGEKLRVAVDAPDLSLKELGGKNISLKDLRGKIVVLNFFATWCPHCQREAPSMAQLHEEFKSTDLVLLKVATKEKENDLRKHKNEFHINFPILMDVDASCANGYGVWSRPATFFINREGKIVGRLVKEVEWTSRGMRKLIESLLKGEKP